MHGEDRIRNFTATVFGFMVGFFGGNYHLLETMDGQTPDTSVPYSIGGSALVICVFLAAIAAILLTSWGQRIRKSTVASARAERIIFTSLALTAAAGFIFGLLANPNPFRLF